MSRRHSAEKREVIPDPKFGDIVVTKFMNSVMYEGKKSTAERIVYGAFDMIKEKTDTDPLTIFKKAMDNVRPTLDYNFRTLTDPRNTLVGGSSMGGLISLYAGTATNVFGGVLAMSPALTRATNFTAALWSHPKREMRVYLDTGTAEGQVGPTPGGDYWEKPLEGYDIFLSHGHAVNGDLLWRAGCGAVHNELACRARISDALVFLLDVREEPHPLLAAQTPPHLSGFATGTVSVPSLRHHEIRFDATAQLNAPHWQPLATSAVERLPWGSASFTSAPSSTSSYIRAVAIPRP